MLHRKRVWQVTPAESLEWLAEKLTQFTWCGCSGFSLGSYLFVNDATSGDGAQEYAVLRRREEHYVQIESLTFSWMSEAQALALIEQVLAGNFDEEHYGAIEPNPIQTPEEHGRCHLCQ